VLIHDGARPFITKEFVENIIKQVIDCKACIVGTPVKETIKVVDNSGMIISTPERSTLWAAQTPQAFEYNAIRKAYDRLYLHDHKEELAITDDAMVYETFLKKPVKLLMGDYHNIKITVTEDLKLAEALINDFIV
jgi:2-C-methyl-D-erythritol 4-phosphate cytidylyltransferase